MKLLRPNPEEIKTRMELQSITTLITGARKDAHKDARKAGVKFTNLCYHSCMNVF